MIDRGHANRGFEWSIMDFHAIVGPPHASGYINIGNLANLQPYTPPVSETPEPACLSLLARPGRCLI